MTSFIVQFNFRNDLRTTATPRFSFVSARATGMPGQPSWRRDRSEFFGGRARRGAGLWSPCEPCPPGNPCGPPGRLGTGRSCWAPRSDRSKDWNVIFIIIIVIIILLFNQITISQQDCLTLYSLSLLCSLMSAELLSSDHTTSFAIIGS